MDKIKKSFEMLALFLTGAFIFVTWGVDQVKDRAPSWKIWLEIHDQSRMRSIKNNNLEACSDRTDCDTVACKLSATVRFKNESKRAVRIHETEIAVVEVAKPNGDGADRSPYTIYDEFKKKPVSEQRKARVFTTFLDELDESPLFSEIEATRPFTFIVNKGDKTEAYLEEYGFLIRVTQNLTYKDALYFWETRPEQSVTMMYDDTVCGYGFQQVPKEPSDEQG